MNSTRRPSHRWEGPINAEMQYTARVLDPADVNSGLIDTQLEGMAAIASAIHSLTDELRELREAVAGVEGSITAWATFEVNR